MAIIKRYASTKNVLAIILFISVILRLASSFFFGNNVIALPGVFDQISYHNLALRIIDGYGFTFGEDWWPATRAGEPTAHWSFLYTFYLVATYYLFGPNPLAARLIQAVLVGILHPLFAYLIARKIYNEKIGLIAALITALYIYFIYYSAALMTEAFFITAIMALFYLCMIPLNHDNRQRFPSHHLLIGLLLALIILLRQLFLLFVPFLLLWLWLRDGKQNWLHTGLKLIIPLFIIILMILPITFFNYTRFQRFVLLNTNAGYAFFFGNHPIYGTRFVDILPPEMGNYSDLIPAELFPLDEAALDQALLSRAIDFIVQNPGRYVLLSISRIPVYFQFWPSPESGLFSNIARVCSFGLLWPFIAYGLYRSYTHRYLRNISQPFVLLLLFSLIYTAIHLLTWTLIRYRLPVDAVMIIPASLGIYDIAKRAIHTLSSGQQRKAVL